MVFRREDVSAVVVGFDVLTRLGEKRPRHIEVGGFCGLIALFLGTAHETDSIYDIPVISHLFPHFSMFYLSDVSVRPLDTLPLTSFQQRRVRADPPGTATLTDQLRVVEVNFFAIANKTTAKVTLRFLPRLVF